MLGECRLSKTNPKLENLYTVGYEQVSLTLEQRQLASQSQPAPTRLHLLEWALLVAKTNPENARLGLVQGNALIVRCSPKAGTSEGGTPGKALADFILFKKIPMKPNKNEKIEARHFVK